MLISGETYVVNLMSVIDAPTLRILPRVFASDWLDSAIMGNPTAVASATVDYRTVVTNYKIRGEVLLDIVAAVYVDKSRKAKTSGSLQYRERSSNEDCSL